MPRRKVTPELMERMRELRAKGWPYQRIAAELGLSVMTVYNHLKKAEVGEPRGEATRGKEEEKKEKKGLLGRLFGR
jgi:DNA invertase Pin-like site-specific DNA recombinase